MLRRIVALTAITLVAIVTTGCAGIAPAGNLPQGKPFVERAGPELRLNGNVFRFAGTNNYYLMYKSRTMVDDVLEAAAANHLTVVRTWGWLDIGSQDGSNSIRGKSDGVYFQYWDGTKPAYNDGADGLQRLDYVIAKAGQAGLRLVIPFTNNWADFGGMDQYVKWRGGRYHDQFYTDPVIRQWYKDWIAHLLNRTNSITGIKYKDDPTIMTWELANEPRCKGSDNQQYPQSSDCRAETLIAWADEMSTFIKSIDQKHLVSVGDEGFYCASGAGDWTDNCNEGVDTLAFTQLENVDVMSFHLYPDHWGKDARWGKEWIARHIRDAQKLGKPAMLGEFGLLSKNARNGVYQEWTDTVFTNGGAGALYWILSGREDNGTLYPDYDGFTVYADSPVFTTFGNFGKVMTANETQDFAPVADHDTAVTEFGKLITFNPTRNDLAYGGAKLNLASIDLDTAAANQQTSLSVDGGTFTLQPDGKLDFTPGDNFVGKATTSYTLQDSSGRTSNVATITVTVKPEAGGGVKLFSFEAGIDGWASASWEAGRATAAQSPVYHTDGSYGLEVKANAGGWFGVTVIPAADLSETTHLKFNFKSGGATSTKVALQTGDSWTWREYTATSDSGPAGTTVDIDLLSGGAEPTDFAKVQAIYIYLQPGTHYIDNVRAE